MRLWLGKGLGYSADCATERPMQLARLMEAAANLADFIGIHTPINVRSPEQGAPERKRPTDLRLSVHSLTGRCERIRTFDPLHPMQVRYQAAPHTDRALNYNPGIRALRPRDHEFQTTRVARGANAATMPMKEPQKHGHAQTQGQSAPQTQAWQWRLMAPVWRPVLPHRGVCCVPR